MNLARFGPLDDIRLDEMRQTGAAGIVTALPEIPYGEVAALSHKGVPLG